MYLCINIWAAVAIVAGLVCVLVWSDYKEKTYEEEENEPQPVDERECDCDV